MKQDAVAASLELCGPGMKSDDEADQVTRRMLQELRGAGVEATMAKAGAAESGTKGAEMVEAGKLLLTLLPIALPYLSGVLHEWLGRKNGRSIKLKTASGLEIEATGGMSMAEIEQMVQTLDRAGAAGHS